MKDLATNGASEPSFVRVVKMVEAKVEESSKGSRWVELKGGFRRKKLDELRSSH